MYILKPNLELILVLNVAVTAATLVIRVRETDLCHVTRAFIFCKSGLGRTWGKKLRK